MKKQLSLLVFSLIVFMVVFSTLNSNAQDSMVRIESDTLFVNGDKVARYQVGEVKGKAVSIETFFFEKDGNQVYSNYLKLFEHKVRQDIQGRGMFKGYEFYFAYGFNEVISPEYVGIPESAEMDTSGTVSFSKNQVNEVGDQMIKAGKLLNGAILFGIASGIVLTVLSPYLTPLVFTASAIGCGTITLIMTLSGNFSISEAGRELKKRR